MPIVDRRRPPQRVPIEAVCPTCQNVLRGVAVDKEPFWDRDLTQGSWSSCTDGNDTDLHTGWVCPSLEYAKRQPHPPR